MKKSITDEITLRRLYLEEKKPVREIANFMRCSYATVFNSLLRLKIPLRGSPSKRLWPPPPRDRREYNRLWRNLPHAKKLRSLAYQRLKDQRNKLFQQLGQMCFICNTTNRLLLHHIFYENGEQHIVQTYKTIKQAQANPAKFAVLCRTCHRDLHWMLREPGRIQKFQELIRRYEEQNGN